MLKNKNPNFKIISNNKLKSKLFLNHIIFYNSFCYNRGKIICKTTLKRNINYYKTFLGHFSNKLEPYFCNNVKTNSKLLITHKSVIKKKKRNTKKEKILSILILVGTLYVYLLSIRSKQLFFTLVKNNCDITYMYTNLSIQKPICIKIVVNKVSINI